jgi:hypothetical protein
MAITPPVDLTTEGYTLIGDEWIKVTPVPDESENLVEILSARFSPTTGRRLADERRITTAEELLLKRVVLEHELLQLREVIAVAVVDERED